MTHNAKALAPLLPSGLPFKLATSTGRDLANAQRHAPDPSMVTFVLLAMLVRVKDAELTLEEVLDLDLADTLYLFEQLTGQKGKPDHLPSGKPYAVRKGKAKDLLAAQREAKDGIEVPFALVAALATVDHQQLFLDDVLGLGLPDVMVLLEAVTGKVPTPAPNA